MIDKFAKFIPDVEKPTQQMVSFNTKLKWTLLILVIYFILTLVPLFGLPAQETERFKMLSILIGATFGSILSLGIGPIVTSSIVLQLLVGADIVKIDMTSEDGRKKFQALQKVLSVIFIFLEGAIYVFLGGLTAAKFYDPASASFVSNFVEGAIELCIGGFLVMLMDDLLSKWGFGSGISLFIVAGVSRTIFIETFSWLRTTGGEYYDGALLAIFQALSKGDAAVVLSNSLRIIFTLLVFAASVFLQSLKIEIPLAPGRVRGFAIRWPLNFIYTSNIPVILTATLLANVSMVLGLIGRWTNQALDQFSVYFSGPNVVGALINNSFTTMLLIAALTYLVLMVGGSILFSLFWVKTSGMDPKSQANQILSSGLQIPGFRRDSKILERMLSRYIWPLTVMGGASVGLLAALADMTNALSRGTGILLSVMIVYKLYEDITKQHLNEMNPAIRKFIKG
jgi:preprotein translocase subunit SecY